MNHPTICGTSMRHVPSPRIQESPDRTSARAAVGIGGNIGDCQTVFQHAIDLLRETPGLTFLQHSGWYETTPVGFLNQPRFLNGVLLVETTCSPHQLLATLLSIETRLGRVRERRNGPRVIDLDLLLYGEHVVQTPDLILPHPRMTERAFVLVPLAELIPDAVHPVLRRSIASLLGDLGSVAHLVSRTPVTSSLSEGTPSV